MFGAHDLLAFAAAAVALILTPGPDTMYIVGRTVSQGRTAGMMSALGINVGCLVHISLAAFGLSAILATSAAAFAVLKYAGAAYLIYLGVQALRKKAAGDDAKDARSPESAWIIFRQGFLTNVLNPKVAIFFLALLPQFVVPESGLGPIPFLFLGAIFLIPATLWCVLLVHAACFATSALGAHPKAISISQKLTGALFIGLGLYLLGAKPQPSWSDAATLIRRGDEGPMDSRQRDRLLATQSARLPAKRRAPERRERIRRIQARIAVCHPATSRSCRRRVRRA